MKQILASLLLFCAALAGAQTVPPGTPQEYGIAARNPASGNFYYVPLDAVGKLYTTSVGYTGAATSVSGYIPPVALVGVGPSGFIYLNADASGNLQVDVTTTTDVNAQTLQGVAISATPPTTSQVLQFNGSVWIPATLSGTGTVTSVATTSPITGGTFTSTGTIACPTCAVTTNPLSQFNATTSSQLAGIISDETGSGSLVFSNGATLNTVTISSVLTLSSFTGTQCLHEVAGVVGVTGADCGSGGGGGGSFSAITTGTNTNALTVGSGGTLNFSGSGTINASSLGGSVAANFPQLASVQSFTAAQTNSANGAASTAAQAFTGIPFTAGSATTNFPLVYLNAGTGPTSFSTAGTEFGINSPSGFTGNFIDTHVNGGGSLFSVNYQGTLSTVAETLTGGSFTGTQCLHEVAGVIGVTGSDCGSVATVAFSGITAGTSTVALVIGSSGSLGVSGSGTIAATSAINLTGTGVDYAPYQSSAGTTSYIIAPTTASHVYVYAWSPNGGAVAPTALDLGTYLASPPAIGGSTANTGTFTQMTVTPPAGNSGYINMPGNTVNQAVTANTVGWMGPTISSFTSYALQMPSTGPTNTNNTLQCGTPTSNVSVCIFGVGGGGGSTANLTGGAVGSAVYQSAANTTAFLASPTTSGHTFFMGWTPSGSALAPTSIDLATYLASPAAIGGTVAAAGTFTQVTVPPPSGDAGYINMPGNTANQAVTANTVGVMGPTSSTFTGYALQLPATGPTNSLPVLSCGTPSSGVSPCTFVANGSGAGTVTGSPQYQMPFYSSAGTSTTVTGSPNIITDASGDLLVNTPVATAIANSPAFEICGVYESTAGPTYSADCWSLSSAISGGVNGASVLSLTHSAGTTGFLQVTINGLLQATNIGTGGTVQSNTYQSEGGGTTAVVYLGGQDGANAGAAGGSGTFRGANNPSATGTGGDAILEPGSATVSGGVQGKAKVQQSFTVASALGATFEVVAMTTTGDVVAASTAGTLYTNVGIAQTIGGTNTQLYVAVEGKTTVRFDGTPVIGDIACTPTTTTGLAHDNGSSACTAGERLGVVTGQVSGSGSGATATVLLHMGS